MLQQQGQIPSCTLAETLLPQPLHPTFPLAPTAPFNAGRASGTCWGLPRDTGHQGLSQGMPESGQIQGAVSLRAQGSASLTP